MKSYRFIFILFFIFLINFNLTDLNGMTKDNTPPSIEIVTPSKSQEYIVSKPTIKATFFDKSGVDISSIKLYVNNKDVTKKSKITKDSIKYTPSKKFKRGTQIVKIIASDNEKNKKTLEWHFVVGTPIYKNFRGIFLNDLYAEISKSKKLYDYCIVSNPINISRKNLNDFEAKTKKYSINYKFICLNTFKTAVDSTDNQIYILNLKDNTPYKDISDLSIDKVYSKLFLDDNLICGFFPKSNELNCFNYMKYSKYGDEIFYLIDITDKNSKESFSLEIYDQALNNSWHISPFSSEFTTKILATDLNKDSLLDALKNRRTYTTADDSLNLEFNINECPMGSIIKNPTKLNFCISAVNSKEIKNISIISNNKKIIKNINCNSNLVKSEFILKEFEKNSFYYLIIEHADNKLSVSSPIWIEGD